MRGIRALILASVMGLFSVVISTCAAGAESAARPGAGKAPDFSLKEVKGAEVKLSDFKGRVVLLTFGATWCPHCRREVQELKKLVHVPKS